MVYVSNDNMIKWVLRPYRGGKDRVVNIGLEYKPPPQNFVKPIDNREGIIKALQGYDTIGRAIARGLG
ncbi:hypothetical protein [Vulcanisaeta distributa]|uniref:hypothetical protein n=1 Tax=Vulcanisaeta distributa TaxID=164451 RepID=UPI0006CF2B2D|nr:hypothetical protein [Vulcanisaeta distributa]